MSYRILFLPFLLAFGVFFFSVEAKPQGSPEVSEKPKPRYQPPPGPLPKLTTPDLDPKPVEPLPPARAQALEPVAKVLINPTTVVKWAAADIMTVPESERHFCRYLTIYNYMPDERIDAIACINIVLNSLNRKTKILSQVAVVPGTDNTLLRVNLFLFNIEPEDWAEMGLKGSGIMRSIKKIDQSEPYFHMAVAAGQPKKTKKMVDVTPYKGSDGYTYNKKWEEVTEAGKAELVHGPWVFPDDIKTLALATKTDFPLYRGDWFMGNAVMAPAYYSFLKIKTIQDVWKIARFDPSNEDLATKGIVTNSEEVSLNIRSLRRTPTASGFLWESYDYLTSIGEDDLLEHILLKRRDAGELIFLLPNGLQAYALVDGKDKIIDFGDTQIVVDTKTPWKNKAVWTAVSCMICHNKGIKDIQDEVRLLAGADKAPLYIKKRKDFEQVINLFSQPLETTIAQDQAIYARNIAAAAGVLPAYTPQRYSLMLQRFFVRYWQDPLTLAEVVMETGRPPDDILGVIKITLNPNHTLSQIYSRRPIRRDQWETKGFEQMMQLPPVKPVPAP